MADDEIRPEVSVLVAMYNAEATIERALKSVIEQTYSDWEIVVVDDASTDSGPEIVSRIRDDLPAGKLKVVRLNDNSGVSVARNTALENSSGQWVTFLDADDEFTPNRLAEMISATDDAVDIVICWHTLVQADGARRQRGPAHLGRAGGRTAMLALLNDRLTPYLWDKLFRRSVIAGFRFPEGIHRAEDALFCLTATSAARQVVSLESVGYVYYVSSGSLTWGRVATISESLSLMDHMAAIVSEFDEDRQVRQGLTVSYVLTFLNTANQAVQLLKTEQREDFIRALREQISWTQILTMLRGRPDLGVAAVGFKAFPSVYEAAYRRYIKRAYSLNSSRSSA